jgi:hypothetical protein
MSVERSMRCDVTIAKVFVDVGASSSKVIQYSAVHASA